MTQGMAGPTFSDIRRQFGTGPALVWIVMLWRWGLLGAGVRQTKSKPRYARQRPRSRATSIAEWAVLAIVGGVWMFWAFFMVKAIVVYTHHGN